MHGTLNFTFKHMKPLYIAIIAIIIAGGTWWYLISNEEAPTADEEIPTTEDTDTESTIEEDEQIDVETETSISTEQGASVGETDTGMEFPIIDETDAQPIVIEVRGSNFEFDVTEIRVKEGDTVQINFESADGFHDWVVDEFDAATAQVRPGTPATVTFVADKAGSFEYYCSVGNHRERGMVGTLVVEPA
jgi:nitrite reductase (NO-forming)